MRFDKPIYFQLYEQGEYNPETGDYEESLVSEVKKYADETDAGAETLNLIYGTLQQGAKVLRLQQHYNGAFDRIRIGSKVYRVDFERKLRQKHVFVVSEVQ